MSEWGTELLVTIRKSKKKRRQKVYIYYNNTQSQCVCSINETICILLKYSRDNETLSDTIENYIDRN